MSKASPIEQWAFFMLNADNLTMDDVRRLFADPEFTEAAEVLEMISKTPEQQMRYDARLKFQLDEAARMEQALREGRAAGRAAGRAEGRVEGRVEGLREGLREGIREGEMKGRVEGRREGELVGTIKVLQNLLGIAEPTPEELNDWDEARLSELAEQLQQQLRGRG